MIQHWTGPGVPAGTFWVNLSSSGFTCSPQCGELVFGQRAPGLVAVRPRAVASVVLGRASQAVAARQRPRAQAAPVPRKQNSEDAKIRLYMIYTANLTNAYTSVLV